MSTYVTLSLVQQSGICLANCLNKNNDNFTIDIILTSKTNNSHGGVAMRGELLLLRMPQPQMEARV